MSSRKWKYTAVLACALMLVSIFCFIVLSGRLSGINPEAYVSASPDPGAEQFTPLQDSTEGVAGMALAAKNDSLSLYINEDTTVIAVKDHRSGEIWYSNPLEMEEDGIATAFEKESIASQVTVSFRNTLGVLDTYTNYKYSISNGQFELQGIKDGVRIEYTLGDAELGIDALPKFISKQRLQEKVLSKLDEVTASYVETRYLVQDANPEVVERADTQVERPLVLRKMLAAFEQAGYTPEDLAYDNEENGIGGPGGTADKPKFLIPVEYRLEGNALSVTVPLSQLEESEGHQIQTLDLLGYFGAAISGQDGYMLVPDGSGSLIHFDNGKVKEPQYVQPVYGQDPNDNSRTRAQIAEPARLPVFGLKSGDRAFFAVIEEGEGNASIAADISGKQNSFNHVFSRHAVRGDDELELYTGSKVQEIQLLSSEKYNGDIRVKYSFLSGDGASYSGMAQAYQTMLAEQGVLQPLAAQEDIPFYVDIVGAIDKQQSFLGVPYDATVPMTTFKEAQGIAAELQAQSISNIQMQYLGWFGAGLEHELPVKLNTSELGKDRELTALREQLNRTGGELYPDVAFQQVYDNGKGFNSASDAARFITKEAAELSPYDRSLNRMSLLQDEYYLLSPAKLPDVTAQFMEQYRKKDMPSLALRDLGSILHSDYRNNSLIFRNTARAIVEEQIGLLAEEYPNLMISGGNAYALQYAQHLVNIPESSSRFNLTDESVPFYQMVIHGYIDYAGEPVNLTTAANMRQQLLHSLELGSAPHFLWTANTSSELKYTRYDYMYSAQYSNWIEDAVSMYDEVNQVLNPLRTEKMQDRIVHQPGVVEVKYSNGASILINYNSETVVARGVSIPAQDYVIGGDPS
ncbi:DUF5696 domain-containing protein [Paenibacillus urinalis]|uniref:DUF5696 domain-containing protein n=1 Tax=Paenibacillus urinalis TaxID=521520 RepID=A0AAX3N479_9BACL|nr:DUF5696 domain-containing protein [Paenibacillus urinalis]WDH84640.1 DUF5696 domain-containing protein [Paenibacillus urinalis]